MTTPHPTLRPPSPITPASSASPGSPGSPASQYRVTTPRILRSEWHKLHSLRSTWITVASAVVMVLGVGLIMGGTYTSGGGDSDVDTIVLTLYGSMLGQLCLIVLGILMTAA